MFFYELFIGLPLRATLNQELLSIYVKKAKHGGRNFQVVQRTDLEADLKRPHKIPYWVELLALYLCRMIF